MAWQLPAIFVGISIHLALLSVFLVLSRERKEGLLLLGLAHMLIWGMPLLLPIAYWLPIWGLNIIVIRLQAQEKVSWVIPSWETAFAALRACMLLLGLWALAIPWSFYTPVLSSAAITASFLISYRIKPA